MMNALVHTSLVKWDNNIYVVVGKGLFPGIAGITVLFHSTTPSTNIKLKQIIMDYLYYKRVIIKKNINNIITLEPC